MSTMNMYTAGSDEERRLAHRQELKTRLAEMSVAKSKLADLRDIVAKLDADSDEATEQHAAETHKIQVELQGLDKEHVERHSDGWVEAESSKHGVLMGPWDAKTHPEDNIPEGLAMQIMLNFVFAM